MEVVLTGELESFIQKEVHSGRYHDAIDVVRDALKTLRQQREWFESPELEAELLKGLEGTPKPLDSEMWDRIRKAAAKELSSSSD